MSEPIPEASETVAAAAPKSRAGFVRLGILFSVMLALYVVGRVTGVTDSVDVETVRGAILEAGALGAVAYIAIFTLGELVHLPGIVFVVAGLLVWGNLVGLGLGFVAAMVSVSVSFFVVRAVGGQALSTIERPFMKRILARIDARPLTTVVLLRFLLFLAPPVNYGLALSRIRFRDYFIGSAIGLAPPFVVITLLFDWVLTLVG